jgi:protein-tyrosine-phosphatase
MPSILFVCTANQFRSPIAAAYFTHKLSEEGISGTWLVESAGTWTTPGRKAHPQAIASAVKLGLDLKLFRTREVDAALLSAVDLIVVMELGHKEALEAEFPAARGRVVLLGKLANVPGDEIPDFARDNFNQPEMAARMVCASIDKCFAELVSLSEHRSKNQRALRP